MQSETKTCQNCKGSFTIVPDDFSFYEKIKVPPPTFCPDCRRLRRLAFRNTHSLYKRKDGFSGKDIISIYSPDKELLVISRDTWWGDEWDPLDYGRDYDFSKPFFEQWKELRNAFPLQSLLQTKSVNSDYCNVAEESKDCYLISASWKNERVSYSDAITDIKDSMDLHVVHRSEFSYDDVVCSDSYQLFYSQDSHSCVNSYFLYDCRGCTDCFMCSNQRKKSYCMYNQQLSKDEYLNKLNEMNLGSYESIQEKKKEFEEMRLKATHRFAHIVNSTNSTGNNIERAKNCHECFDLSGGLEDCKYASWAVQAKDVYDAGPGFGVVELVYETFDCGPGGRSVSFSNGIHASENIEYCFDCSSSSNLFGCLGLKSKQYCIFNKQYSKEEYIKLREKIIQQMNEKPYVDKRGIFYRYGEFFPVELSPFCYNETVAQDYFPLEKDQALKNGFSWKDPEARNYQPTIKAKDLPDNIKFISDSILDEVIECEHQGKCKDRCTTAFKIIPDELTFYKRFNIPLPRICYGCRHYGRLAKRNPMKLWHRKCMNKDCTNEFETSYAPERKEIVFCEQCYQNEVS